MKKVEDLPNSFRKDHPLYGPASIEHGHNGYFEIPRESYILRVIASVGGGWDHVSVSLPNRCPNWSEMCRIKELFFNDDETVWQYHPKRSEYVNAHQKQDFNMPLPEKWMIA